MSLKTGHDKVLFWGCFIALIATAFGFIIRAQVIGDWGTEFGLSETQKGEIFGAGLYPFAISIVLFSLIIDRIGYKTAMIFGFCCHVIATIMTITAKNYTTLYWGNFIVALGNGTVEAYINPVAATMFSKDKTKWLNILHAGWPGGMVLGGILAIMVGKMGDIGVTPWKLKVMLIFIPTVIYFVMLMREKFPVNERVAAGVSYRDMIKEVGAIGMFIIFWMIFSELSRVTGLAGMMNTLPLVPGAIGAAAVAIATFAYVKSLGRPMFIFLLIVMIPLATTELGVDSWVTDLMGPAMGKYAPWLLVYTSFIMMVLRFNAGGIIHKLSPLGTLAVCATLAACGLLALSGAHTAGAIIAAATLYGVGKTFFWPTTLGVTTEQFPRGGAMTLNSMGGTGMLGVGVIGAMIMGNIQDHTIDKELAKRDAAVHAQVTISKAGLLGAYQAIDAEKVAVADVKAQELVKEVQAGSKQISLKKVAVLPCFMLVSYLILLAYFKSKGGYKPVELTASQPQAH
jgi:MFS family permease